MTGAQHRFWNPVDVRLGRGCVDEISGLIGTRSFAVVTTPGMVHRPMWRQLEARLPGTPLGIATVGPNPTFECIEACHAVTDPGAELIVAVGGGSAIDTAKCVAWLPAAAPPGTLRAMLAEGAARPEAAIRPVIAVPTTAGTGSEVTSWATVWESGTGRKFSVSAAELYPQAALVDPSMLDSLRFEQSLPPALDALSHACEAVWNRRANPVADSLAEIAIRELAGILSASFETSFAEPTVRERLQAASLLAGLAFSSTRTALAHSISYPVTGLWGVPHGLACSTTLPEVLQEAAHLDPARVQPIVRGLSALDAADAVLVMAAVLRESGGDHHTGSFLRASSRAADLEPLLVTPGRADNFLGPVTNAGARAILERALARVGSA